MVVKRAIELAVRTRLLRSEPVVLSAATGEHPRVGVYLSKQTLITVAAWANGWVVKHMFPVSEVYQLSHETICRSLSIQACGALGKELLEHFRRTRVKHRSRHYTQEKENHGGIRDMVSISERPAIVENRAVSGLLATFHGNMNRKNYLPDSLT
jgi:hypothetical protein